MAEKTREQWVRAIRRWAAVGAVAGLLFGVYASVAWDGSLIGSLAFYVPMGASLVLMLWASTYRYEFAKVWGWRLMGLSFLVMFGLLGAAIGVGCLQGICGER